MWPYSGVLLNKCKASSKAFSEVLACAAARNNTWSKVCNMEAILCVRTIVHRYQLKDYSQCSNGVQPMSTDSYTT